MKEHMSWYKKVLKKNTKEAALSAAFAVVFALAVLLWHFAFGKSFHWETIKPISEPALSIRLLSALVFISFGRILYELKFYYVLYFIFVVLLKAKDFYRDFKKVVWYSLMFITGFVVVPWIIDVLNAVISFFYNILNLILYLFPPLGASLIVFGIGYTLFNKYLRN